MRNLARVILLLVGLFVVLVAGTLVAKSRTAPVESVGASPSTADLRIKEVDLEEEAKGVRWRLKAEQALLFERAGRTKLRNLAVSVVQRDRSWTVVGEEGELNTKTNDVEVSRNVVVTSSDGMRLETSVLRWDAAGRRLWTDAPVRLSRYGSEVQGTGLDVRIADESTTVSGRVHARFVQGRGR